MTALYLAAVGSPLLKHKPPVSRWSTRSREGVGAPHAKQATEACLSMQTLASDALPHTSEADRMLFVLARAAMAADALLHIHT